MFGHHNDDNQTNQPAQPVDDQAPVAQPTDQVVQPDEAPALEVPASQNDDSPWQHPGTPLDGAQPAPAEPEIPPAPISDVTPGEGTTPSPRAFASPAEEEPHDDSSSLIDIRQKALGDLSPLIEHLEHQTPEEKFQVTMMMIQANDDKSLVSAAYEAAQQITDEKVRAQALLDIVQEINYFTQHQS
jgi:hypothetical protein